MRRRITLVALWILTTAIATLVASQAVTVVAHNVIERATFGGAPSHGVKRPAASAAPEVLFLPASAASTVGTDPQVTALAPTTTVAARNPAPRIVPAAVVPSRPPTGRAPAPAMTTTETTAPAEVAPVNRGPAPGAPVTTLAPTTVPRAATVPPTTPTTSPHQSVVVLSSEGGSVSVTCPTRSTISLVGASPDSGFNVTIRDSGPEAVAVSFTRPGARTGIQVFCAGGVPRTDD